jgi:hypothetical protein
MADAVQRRIAGDTFPIKAICYYYGDPYDWTGATATTVLEELVGTAVTEAGTVTAHPTQTCTAGSGSSGDEDYIRCRAHGVKPGNQIVFATSGTLPTGLTAGTVYYAVNVHPNEFKVSTVPGGNPVDITASSGSGAHTFYIVGSIEYTPATAEVTSSKSGWFVSTESGVIISFPADKEGFTMDVQAQGN